MPPLGSVFICFSELERLWVSEGPAGVSATHRGTREEPSCSHLPHWSQPAGLLQQPHNVDVRMPVTKVLALHRVSVCTELHYIIKLHSFCSLLCCWRLPEPPAGSVRASPTFKIILQTLISNKYGAVLVRPSCFHPNNLAALTQTGCRHD